MRTCRTSPASAVTVRPPPASGMETRYATGLPPLVETSQSDAGMMVSPMMPTNSPRSARERATSAMVCRSRMSVPVMSAPLSTPSQRLTQACAALVSSATSEPPEI